MKSVDLRLAVLLCAIIIYAAFGQPTPSAFGMAEAMIAVSLICAMSSAGLYAFLNIQQAADVDIKIFVFFGLSWPLLIGALHAHETSMIMRDVIAFSFLCLPLFLYGLLSRKKSMQAALYSFTGLGVILSIRDLGLMGEASALDYLANSPAVLFSALYLSGAAISIFCKKFSARAAFMAAGLIAISILPTAAMIETQQRASLGMLSLGLLILSLYWLWHRPKRMLILLLYAAPFIWALSPEISDAAEALIDKSNLVGFNAREQEWIAVWSTISESPLTLLLGLGWGASFASPAVAEIDVTFTHSLLSYMLLKTGLIGFTLTAALTFSLFKKLVIYAPTNPALILALAAPLVIDVFLYAAYKSLDFGLLLCLIIALPSYARFSANQKPSNIEARPNLRYV